MDESSIVLIVVVVLTTMFAALALVVCWTALTLFRPSSGGSDEESKLMQELYEGLQRMEQRVESLETLLLESEQHARKPKRN